MLLVHSSPIVMAPALPAAPIHSIVTPPLAKTTPFSAETSHQAKLRLGDWPAIDKPVFRGTENFFKRPLHAKTCAELTLQASTHSLLSHNSSEAEYQNAAAALAKLAGNSALPELAAQSLQRLEVVAQDVGLTAPAHQAAFNALYSLAQQGHGTVVTMRLLESFLQKEDLDAHTSRSTVDAIAQMVLCSSAGITFISDATIAALNTLLLKPEQEPEVSAAVTDALGSIISNSHNELHLDWQAIAQTLLNIFLAKDLQPANYTNAADTLIEVIAKQPKLSASTLRTLETMLQKEGLTSAAYPLVAHVMIKLGREQGEIITTSIIEIFARRFLTEQSRADTCQHSAQAIGFLLHQREEAALAHRAHDLLVDILRKEQLFPNVYQAIAYELGKYYAQREQAIPVALLELFQVRQISFADSGQAKYDIASFAEAVLQHGKGLQHCELPKGAADEFPLKEPLDCNELNIHRDHNQALSKLLADYALHEIQGRPTLGRTIVLKHKYENRYLALKLMKAGERPEELRHEHRMLCWIDRWKDELGLRSDYPQALPIAGQEVLRVDNAVLASILSPGQLRTALGPQLKLYEHEDSYILTAYTTHAPDYFTYLNNPSLAPQQFRQARDKGLHDLFTLARYGIIHPDLIELFHNVSNAKSREDQGKYLWMVDIIRGLDKTGTGRMHAWLNALNFPNLRRSGLADLANLTMLTTMLADPTHPTSRYLMEVRSKTSEQQALRTIFLSNFLGEYQLAASLITGSWLYHRQELDWQSPEGLSQLIQESFELGWTIFRAGEADPLASVTHWTRLARQMAYFMSGVYITDFAPERGEQRRTPPNLYSPLTTIRFGNFRPNTWSDHIGWMGLLPDQSADNASALGPVNGPFCCTELIVANYLYSMALATGADVAA